MLSLDRWSSLGVSLSCVVGMAWCDMAKLEGGICACLYVLRICKFCPECGVHVLCLCRKGFVWSDWWEKLTFVRKYRHQQGSASMKRFTGLSRSSLTVHCAGVSSAFHLPIVGVIGLVAITTALFTSWARAWHDMAVWPRTTYQYHMTWMDTVGRTTCSRRPH